MSTSTRVTGELEMLLARRQEVRRLYTDHLERLVAAGRGQEQVDVKGKSIESEMRQLDARIKHAQAESKRAGNPKFGTQSRATAMH